MPYQKWSGKKRDKKAVEMKGSGEQAGNVA